MISVVVPVLNEAERLPKVLRELAALGVDQLVVSDGRSTDGSADIALHAGAQVVQGAPGRGRQLARGLAACTHDVVWFVHADCTPPADALGQIRWALRQPGAVGGAFRTRHVLHQTSWIRAVLPMADLRPRYTRFPYGDQALFALRKELDWVGVPDQPLLEDLELSRRLARRGKLITVPSCVEVSARRYAASPWRTALFMNTFPALSRLGVPPSTLAQWYGAAR